MGGQAFEIEQALIRLPGSPERWIWAFTCPEPECACRTVTVLSTAGGRDALAECGRPVAEAWGSRAFYGQAAQRVQGAAAFAIDLDTHEVYPPAGEAPLDVAACPEIGAIVERLNDEVFDTLARIWLLGKSAEFPTPPGADGNKIPIEGWRPGDLVAWDDAQQVLRGDIYVIGDRVFHAVERYCVAGDCDCGEVVVDFVAIFPRGAPHPGYVEFDGRDLTLHPDQKRHRARLNELWDAYCRRHGGYGERFAARSATMHDLAGRITRAPSRAKIGRNAACPCGSGKKYKKCCGASATSPS
jgi:hypothetical protein